MTVDRDLLTALGLDLKCSKNVILGGEGLYKGCSVPIVDVGNYDFNIIMSKIVKLGESFINTYANKCLEYGDSISATFIMHRILDSKYVKADLKRTRSSCR